MGLLLSSVAVVLLAADPAPSGSAVVVSRRANVSTADAQALALRASALLRELSVPLTLDADAATTRLAKLGVPDPAACAGRKPCIAELGAQLKVAWVIAVSVSQVDTDRSLAFELVRIADQTTVEKDALILPAKSKLTAALLDAFAVRCRAALQADAPRETKLTPGTVEPPVVPPLVATPEPNHTASFVLGGAGAIAVGAGVALLAMALSTRAELARGTPGPDGTIVSPLEGSVARARNDTANLELGLAAAAAGLGLGLGTAAVVTW